MKVLISQFTYFLDEPEVRKNFGALAKYLAFVLLVVLIYSVAFHLLMLHEGQNHSWTTGFYWTLTVMSTLGFGDITFHSDLGRLFSILVLLSGIILLLIMLPFVFIRYFYAPWLEAQLRLQVPRELPKDMTKHVVICRYNSICRGLVTKLRFNHIPYVVLEPDTAIATKLHAEGITVIQGDVDSRRTYEELRVDQARLIFANAEDTTNTNIAITVREITESTPIIALAENEHSIDILELSGATKVLPLKHRLGEYLATRVRAGTRSVQPIGRFRDLRIGEFLAHNTMFEGKTVIETDLRQKTGATIVGVREKGHLHPITADLRFGGHALPVVIGTDEQLENLERLIATDEDHDKPVLVLGGGKVGLAAANALKRRGITVRVVDKEEKLLRDLKRAGHEVIIGDAADIHVLEEAGLGDAAAAVLTTNDDAINIYLTVYCRKLNDDLNIVSRVTHERNVEAIYRAGADAVLGYSSLGREHVIAYVLGRDPVLVGEGSDFFLVPVPDSLVGATLADSKIGANTGLIGVAIEDGDQMIANPPPDYPFRADNQLLFIGTAEQRQNFEATYCGDKSAKPLT